jgi:hypothetical protein
MRPTSPVGEHGADHILGEDDGRQGVHAHQPLDLRIVREGQGASEADRRIVDEPVERPEVLPHRLDQRGNVVDLGQIKRDEVKGSGIVAPGFLHRQRQLGGLFPCNGDRAVPHAREPARDTQAQSPASAGHDDITHWDAPICLSPRRAGQERR